MANEFAFGFKELLKYNRRTMSKTARTKTRNNPKKTKWLYPYSSEVKYRNMIRNQLGLQLKSIVDYKLDFNLSRWIKEKQRFDNTDDYVDELNQLVIEQQKKMRKLFGISDELPAKSEMWNYVAESADATFEFNTKQWYKTTAGMLGFQFITDTPWWSTERNSWVSENYGLVKALGESYINRVNVIINQGIQDGKTQTEIKKEVQDIYRKIFGPRLDRRMSRAELLVRDQIGRLNGILTKRRFQSAGLNYYIWNTANDERVRGKPRGKYPKAIPSHWEMQGKICRWDDDTVYAEEGSLNAKGELFWKKRTYKMPKAIPGQEILCRCNALIYWNEILKETDEEIENNG